MLLSNKLNVCTFSIIPYDAKFDYNHDLSIMTKAIRALPPPPLSPDEQQMEPEILDKYRKLYRLYFINVYKKYKPDNLFKVERIMQKYSNSALHLELVYGRMIKKYNVDPQDRQPLILELELNLISFNEDETISLRESFIGKLTYGFLKDLLNNERDYTFIVVLTFGWWLKMTLGFEVENNEKLLK